MKTENLLKIIPAIAIILSLGLAAIILYFILKYGVDVPYNDQWNYVEFFTHYKKGTLTLAELFRQQNEFRQFFPNLIFVGLGLLTAWNVKYEMILIFILACLTSFNIYRLANITFQGKKWITWSLFFLSNIFIFSPIQYENWLFGVQIEYLLPMACISSCMLITFTGIKPALKLFFCMLLATISIYSSTNGALCWMLMIPVFILTGNSMPFFRKWRVITIWIAVAALTLFIYFYGYHNPPGYPTPFTGFEQPLDALRYFFGILGNPFRIIHSLNHIIMVGAVLFSIFMLLVAYVFRYYKDKQLIRNSVVWIMTGFYSICTGALVMVGRLPFGVYQSLSSRYTSFTLYLAVATIFLFAIVMQHLASKVRFHVFYKVILVLFFAYVVYVKANTYPVAVRDLKSFHSRIIHGKAGLLFINQYPHENCENKIYPFKFENIKCLANLLDSIGYLRPSLIKSNVIQNIEGKGSGTIACGSLNKLERTDKNNFKVWGTAILPDTHGPADAVLITFDNREGKSLLLDMYNGDSINWTKNFSLNIVPYDTAHISAWAFDATKGKAYRLYRYYSLEKLRY